MSVHTGVAEERDGDYYGPTLNRAARILTAGHGGQILISHATYELVREITNKGMSLLDLGEHRLKDLIQRERIFQLVAADLIDDFVDGVFFVALAPIADADLVTSTIAQTLGV